MATEWESTKTAAEAVLRAVARAGATITYEELSNQIGPLAFSPDDAALGRMLGEISTAEHEAGRGLLSAVVVRKGASRPGSGFFALAARLGHDVGDRDVFWQQELERVYRSG